MKAYDDYCSDALDPFYAACVKLGGGAETSGKVVKEAWLEVRNILLMAIKCQEPPQVQVPKVLSKISDKLKEATSLVKRDPWEKHTKTISEGIGCLNW